MKKILIIKTGSTFPSLSAQKGDFEDWVLSGMDIDKNNAIITDVCNGDPLPDYDQVSGVVITGSHAMVTEHPDWSEQTAEWLKSAVNYSFPVLGICYGHQLLAYALGGEVGDNPKGMEIGTVNVFLNEDAQNDKLLIGLDNPFKAHVSHQQTVLKLPEHATRLAVSSGDDCQCFVVGNHVWGLQFHPEFDRKMTIAYINECSQELIFAGKDPDALIETCMDTPYGSEILRRFAGFCE